MAITANYRPKVFSGEAQQEPDRAKQLSNPSISSATRQEMLEGLQANDAEKMPPDDANLLSTDEGDR